MIATLQLDDAFQAFLERLFAPSQPSDPTTLPTILALLTDLKAQTTETQTIMGQINDALTGLKTSLDALAAAVAADASKLADLTAQHDADVAKLTDLTAQLDTLTAAAAASEAENTADAATIVDLQKQVDDLTAKLSGGGGPVA